MPAHSSQRPNSTQSAFSTIVWTRREDQRDHDQRLLASLSATIIYAPAFEVTACHDDPDTLREANAAHGALAGRHVRAIVTSREAALQLVSRGDTLLRASASTPCLILTFSQQVAEVLAADARFQVCLYRDITTGQALAERVANEHSQASPHHKLLFAGARQPAFDYPAYFRSRGIACSTWPLYETRPITEPTLELRQQIGTQRSDGHPTLAVFCSPSAVAGFAAQWQQVRGQPLQAEPGWSAVAIGPTTEAVAARYFATTHCAPNARLSSVIATLTALLTP